MEKSVALWLVRGLAMQQILCNRKVSAPNRGGHWKQKLLRKSHHNLHKLQCTLQHDFIFRLSIRSAHGIHHKFRHLSISAILDVDTWTWHFFNQSKILISFTTQWSRLADYVPQCVFQVRRMRQNTTDFKEESFKVLGVFLAGWRLFELTG